jgi:hypothetical protein
VVDCLTDELSECVAYVCVETGEAFVQLCNLVVPSRSDGGCWNPESEILKSEKDGKKEPKEEPTKASTLAN